MTTSSVLFRSRASVEQQIDNRVAGFGIEVAGRFVRKNNLGIVRQRARDRDPLLFAAGKFGRQMMQPIAQTNRAQTLFAAASLTLAADHSGQHDILQRGQFRQQEISLENKTHFLFRICACDGELPV